MCIESVIQKSHIQSFDMKFVRKRSTGDDVSLRRSEKLKFNKMVILKKVLDWIVLMLILCMDAAVIIIFISVAIAMLFNLKEVHNIANDVQ